MENDVSAEKETSGAVGRVPTMWELCAIDEDAMKQAIGWGVVALKAAQGEFMRDVVIEVWDAMAHSVNRDLTPASQERATPSSTLAEQLPTRLSAHPPKLQEDTAHHGSESQGVAGTGVGTLGSLPPVAPTATRGEEQ